MRRRVLALVLVLGFLPTAELVEVALGLAEHDAHADGVTGDDAPVQPVEHGCTALLHVCDCHGSLRGALPALSTPARSGPSDPVAPPAAALRSGRDLDAPALPPPIA